LSYTRVCAFKPNGRHLCPAKSSAAAGNTRPALP